MTGGTRGIGRAVAVHLAAAGYRVLVSGRDGVRGAGTLEALRAAAPGADHRFLPADLSLLGQTAQLAETVQEATDRLDAVVCCGGVLSLTTEYTSEGLERTLVVNYLARFLLARRLLPLLEAAPSGRLVLVANAGKYRDTLDLEDLQHRLGRPGLGVSGRTQFANDLLAVELAARCRTSGVQVTCVYPGVVRTDVFRDARGVAPPLRAAAVALSRVIGADPQDAARTPAFLASAPEAAKLGGRFFGPGHRERRIPDRARRVDRRQALWAASEELVRDHLPPVNQRSTRRSSPPHHRPARAS